MPIKDFEGRGRIPRLGKIRLGIRDQKGDTEYPRMVDFFVCPPEVREVYGEKPKKLEITFHSDDINEIFPQWYKRYGMSTGLICRGDGETAVYLDRETGAFEEIECLGRECEYYQKEQCKQIGNLRFMVLGVKRFGVYQLDTSSYNSILNINGGLEYAKKLTGGRLALVPFILEVIPQEVNPNGHKRTVYVLRLEANIQKMLNALESTPKEVLQLEPSKIDEKKDIEEDLYPRPLVESIKPSPEQLKLMWTLARKAGYPKEEFVKILKSEYGVKESSSELTKEQFEEIIGWLKEEIEENENAQIKVEEANI